MRIISGSYKGKTLFQPTDSKTRPLKDLTKESIFNLLIHSKFKKFDLEKSIVLDLFSGSGSFGLECLSRKVKHVTFVENYKPAIRTFYKNIQYLNNIKNYDLIEKDIFDKKITIYFKKKYDLIFIDPPFKEDKIENIFNIINNSNSLKKSCFLILHRNKKSDNFIPNNFEIVDIKLYGISKFFFYKLK